MATNNAANNIPAAIPITVANGGTGASTLTQNGILFGNGTSAVGVTAAGTNGQLLIAATSANPAFATLTSTLGSITYTAGAGSLNLDVVNWVAATSWTPTLSFGGGSTGITYTTQTGTYRRVGNTVMIQATITLSNKGSSTGAMSIDTLPVTNSSIDSVLALRVSNLTFTGQLFARIPASGTSLILEAAASGGAVATLADTAFSNTTTFSVSGTYLV